MAVHPFLRTNTQACSGWLALNTLGTYDTFNYSGVQAEKVPAPFISRTAPRDFDKLFQAKAQSLRQVASLLCVFA
jgi:hypothetical protein